MNTPIWNQYDNKTYHPEVIDMAFGVLDPQDASEGARVIFEESGIEPYAKNDEQTKKLIMNAVMSGTEHLFHQQSAAQSLELFTLLNHLLFTKKPFSYRHVAYDDIEIGKPQKFITAANNPLMPVGLDDIMLITGTGDKLHKNHLTRFITDHLNNSLSQDHRNLFGSSYFDAFLSSYIDGGAWKLQGGWFEKKDNDLIRVFDSSGDYGLTSNVTATELFRNIFPSSEIVSDTR